MSSYVLLELDTTGPQGQTISAPPSTASRSITLTLACPSTDKFQMWIQGDIVETPTWIPFSTSANVTLTVGDGIKNLSFKVRDDVYNESTLVSTTINLAATTPTVTITTALDSAKISTISGKNVAHFAFSSDIAFIEYKVKVVVDVANTEGMGYQLGTAGGSTNVAATGSFPAATPITVTIYGSDLQTALSGDAIKNVKVFVKNAANVWSIA